jgi:hypothetical protein
MNHLSEKKRLKIKELEPVLIGKVDQLFRNRLQNLQLESPMKKLLTAAVFAAVIATPALAESFSLVRDTVGNCAAVVTSKSPYPGMKVVSHKTYTSWDAASKALDSIKVCTSFVR